MAISYANKLFWGLPGMEPTALALSYILRYMLQILCLVFLLWDWALLNFPGWIHTSVSQNAGNIGGNHHTWQHSYLSRTENNITKGKNIFKFLYQPLDGLIKTSFVADFCLGHNEQLLRYLIGRLESHSRGTV